MTRPLAVLAEIIRGLDQTGAEMVLPDPVDRDACRERVLRVGDPAGERRARSGAVSRQLRQIVADKDRGWARSHGLALAIPIAALQDMNRRALRGIVLDAGNHGGRGREVIFERLD